MHTIRYLFKSLTEPDLEPRHIDTNNGSKSTQPVLRIRNRPEPKLFPNRIQNRIRISNYLASRTQIRIGNYLTSGIRIPNNLTSRIRIRSYQ